MVLPKLPEGFSPIETEQEMLPTMSEGLPTAPTAPMDTAPALPEGFTAIEQPVVPEVISKFVAPEATEDNTVEPAFELTEDGTWSLIQAFGKAVAEGTAQEFAEFAEDPVEFTKDVGASLAGAGESIVQAVKDGKYDIAGGILAQQLGKTVPGLKQIGPRGRSILGSAVGKQLDILQGTRNEESITDSLKESAKEELFGAVLGKSASFGKDLVTRATKKGAPDVISSKLLSRELADGSSRTIAEAADALGVDRLPIMAEVEGSVGKQQLSKLKDKVMGVTHRSAEDSALIRQLNKAEDTFKEFVKPTTKAKKLGEIEGLGQIQTSLKKSYDDLAKGRDKLYTELNTVLRDTEGKIPVSNLNSMLDDVYHLKAGGVTDADATKIYNKLRELTFDKKAGIPRDSISLSDWEKVQNDLRKMVGDAAAIPGKAKELDGIIGKFRNEVLDPYENAIMEEASENGRFLHPDVYDYLDIKQEIKGADRTIGQFRDTPIAAALGVSEAGQKVKAASFKDALNSMTKSAASWRESYDQIAGINPRLAMGLKDQYNRQLYSGMMDSQKRLSQAAIANTLDDPIKRELMTEVMGPDYVKGLEDMELVMRGQSKLNDIVGDAGGPTREIRITPESTAQLTAQAASMQKTAAKGSVAGMLLGLKNRLFKTDVLADGVYLDQLKGDEGIKLLNTAIATTTRDKGAYDAYANLMVHLGYKPVSRAEFGEAIELEEE